MAKRKISMFTIINTIALALLTMLMLYPFWYIIVGSVSSTNHIYSGRLLLLPDQINVEAYATMLGNRRVIRSFFNSLFVTLSGTFLSMVLTFMGAYAVSYTHLTLPTTERV